MKDWVSIVAGANLRRYAVAGVGALLGVGLTGLISALA